MFNEYRILKMDEKVDIVLLGATGYTGRLCAAYMSHALPENTTWAIAGRNKSKLQDLYKDLNLEKTKCLSRFVVVVQLLSSLSRHRTRPRPYFR